MSTLKVSTISPLGTDSTKTITIGSHSNGDTAAGVFTNVPAFEAYLASDQSISAETYTKVTIDTEVFDTNSMYDNSTNYRFTPTVAGKYFVYGSVIGESSSNTDLQMVKSAIYKNGSVYKEQVLHLTASNGRRLAPTISANIDFNGSSDYVELYGEIKPSSGSATIEGNGTWDRGTYFGAYRIIGA